MKKLLLLTAIALALCIGAVATAAASSGPIAIDYIQRWLKGGVYIGTGSTADSRNKITNSYSTFASYDFPACSTSGFAAITICDTTTPSFPLGTSTAGPVLGDDCKVTNDHSIADGGTSKSVHYTCDILSPGLVAIIQHYAATDAGVFDAPDSGFRITTTSHL